MTDSKAPLDAEATVDSDPLLERLWGRVLEAWDDDRTHSAFLAHATRVQALPEAAGRYRGLLGEPTRAAVAQRKLDAIVVAATQMLWAMKTPAPVQIPKPILLSAVGVCLFLLTWVGWLLWGPAGIR